MLIRNLKIKMFFCGVLALSAGCATSSRNEAEVNKVKKVAVVAYTATLPTSRTLSLDLGSGKTSSEAGGSILNQTSKATDEILNSVAQSFAKNKRWQVVDVATMKKNPAYIQAYKATMEGWQNKSPAGAGTQNYLSEGVMDRDGVRILGPEGKKQLIKALNVDAVVVANVYTTLEGFKVMGIGKRKPKTQITIYVYNAYEEGPIWFETFVGDETEESVGMTGFIDEEKLQTLALASAKTATAKIK